MLFQSTHLSATLSEERNDQNSTSKIKKVEFCMRMNTTPYRYTGGVKAISHTL